MQLCRAVALSLCLTILLGAGAAETAPREVNVSTDSTPGWVPSVEQEREARETVLAFLRARDGGRFPEAFALFTTANQKTEPAAAFAARQAAFNRAAGAVQERRIVKITWTKDPASAPTPGAYAAVDLVSRFEGISRHCGYVVVVQPPGGAAFQVARVQEAFMDDATAKRIEAEQSAAGVAVAWERVAASCPNYPRAPLPEAPQGTIGYASPAAALAELKTKPGVAITQEDGWTIATERSAMTLWSFAPAGHPAYPAAVKRRVVQEGGAVSVKMDVMCGASKAACDDLVRSFATLNAAMEKSLAGRR